MLNQRNLTHSLEARLDELDNRLDKAATYARLIPIDELEFLSQATRLIRSRLTYLSTLTDLTNYYLHEDLEEASKKKILNKAGIKKDMERGSSEIFCFP